MKTFFALLFSCLSLSAATTITLQWDPNTDNVTGYNLYIGTNSGVYYQSNNYVGVANSTGSFSNLANGPYYFAATAYLMDGTNKLESGFSGEVSWASAPKAPGILRISNTNMAAIKLKLQPLDNWIIQQSNDLLSWTDSIKGIEGYNSITLDLNATRAHRFYRSIRP